MGAKFAPCMRPDKNLQKVLEEERRNESETGCCIKSDGSGCIQTSQKACSVRHVQQGFCSINNPQSVLISGFYNMIKWPHVVVLLISCNGMKRLFCCCGIRKGTHYIHVDVMPVHHKATDWILPGSLIDLCFCICSFNGLLLLQHCLVIRCY